MKLSGPNLIPHPWSPLLAEVQPLPEFLGFPVMVLPDLPPGTFALVTVVDGKPAGEIIRLNTEEEAADA